ncbi:hypothetical protein FOBRF1_009572 [Fusarium oxysporum]
MGYLRRLQPLQLDLKSCITLGILWLEVNEIKASIRYQPGDHARVPIYRYLYQYDFGGRRNLTPPWAPAPPPLWL